MCFNVTLKLKEKVYVYQIKGAGSCENNYIRKLVKIPQKFSFNFAMSIIFFIKAKK